MAANNATPGDFVPTCTPGGAEPQVPISRKTLEFVWEISQPIRNAISRMKLIAPEPPPPQLYGMCGHVG